MRLIPENIKGKEITASASVKFADQRSAMDFYAIAKQRLLQVNNWNRIAGTAGAEFHLVDKTGADVSRSAEKGDYIRIDIPGPGSKAGEGYDWVHIEDLEETSSNDVEGIAIKVRPTTNPRTSDEHIAHFYAEDSTSTFVITRDNKEVTASVFDRNIEANEETKQPVDKLRNALVGIGARHGFSKLQWQALANGLLKQ